MTLPFDTSQPEVRPHVVSFSTDDATLKRLQELMAETELDRSLIVHRIVKKALDTSVPAEGERRSTDRRKSA